MLTSKLLNNLDIWKNFSWVKLKSNKPLGRNQRMPSNQSRKSQQLQRNRLSEMEVNGLSICQRALLTVDKERVTGLLSKPHAISHQEKRTKLRLRRLKLEEKPRKRLRKKLKMLKRQRNQLRLKLKKSLMTRKKKRKKRKSLSQRLLLRQRRRPEVRKFQLKLLMLQRPKLSLMLQQINKMSKLRKVNPTQTLTLTLIAIVIEFIFKSKYYLLYLS